jgi:UDP-N-acetylmuramoylalanine-D-glutamate ligase
MIKNTQKVTVIGTKYTGVATAEYFKKTFKSVEAMEEWASSEEAINHYHIEGYWDGIRFTNAASKGAR